jgi:hypothetical protein
MNDRPVKDRLGEYLDALGVSQDRDLTQAEVDAIIRFYYAHGLDRLESLQEFFEQMK